jgi:hypothetical protein
MWVNFYRYSTASSSRPSVRAKAVEAPANLERIRISTPWWGSAG